MQFNAFIVSKFFIFQWNKIFHIPMKWNDAMTFSVSWDDLIQRNLHFNDTSDKLFLDSMYWNPLLFLFFLIHHHKTIFCIKQPHMHAAFQYQWNIRRKNSFLFSFNNFFVAQHFQQEMGNCVIFKRKNYLKPENHFSCIKPLNISELLIHNIVQHSMSPLL